jgi:hypothetical protein
LAHSFLVATPLDEVAQLKPRRVVPLIGFSWGFTDNGSRVSLYELVILSSREWVLHLDLLRQAYPRWIISEPAET